MKKKKTVKQFLAEAKKQIRLYYGNDLAAFNLNIDKYATAEIQEAMERGYESGDDWVDNCAAKYDIPKADEVTAPMAIAVLTIEVKKIKDKKHPAIKALAVLTEYVNQKYKP